MSPMINSVEDRMGEVSPTVLAAGLAALGSGLAVWVVRLVVASRPGALASVPPVVRILATAAVVGTAVAVAVDRVPDPARRDDTGGQLDDEATDPNLVEVPAAAIIVDE